MLESLQDSVKIVSRAQSKWSVVLIWEVYFICGNNNSFALLAYASWQLQEHFCNND